MTIAEMRNHLELEQRSNGRCELPSSMPDWAVRRCYELRTGSPLTPFPAGLRIMSDAELRLCRRKTPAPADVRPPVVAYEREAMQRQLQLAAL